MIIKYESNSAIMWIDITLLNIEKIDKLTLVLWTSNTTVYSCVYIVILSTVIWGAVYAIVSEEYSFFSLYTEMFLFLKCFYYLKTAMV